MKASNRSDMIVCPQCGNEFSVYAIKYQGEDPHETNEGYSLCSDKCMIDYLQMRRTQRTTCKSKWSFDDSHIGKTYTGNVINEKIIKRPPGLKRDDWYKFAGQIIKFLK